MFTVGGTINYYGVDHSPSYLWNSASWEISEALLPLPPDRDGADRRRGPRTRRSAGRPRSRDGVILNPAILEFQRGMPRIRIRGRRLTARRARTVRHGGNILDGCRVTRDTFTCIENARSDRERHHQMQFGIFTVSDITEDPTTGRTPSEAEKIRNTITVAKHAEEVGSRRLRPRRAPQPAVLVVLAHHDPRVHRRADRAPASCRPRRR